MSNHQQPYQWQGPNGEWFVGVKAIATNGGEVTATDKSDRRYFDNSDHYTITLSDVGRYWLMALSHTRELVWVDSQILQPYPPSPIPQP